MKLKLIIYISILFLGSCKQQYSYKTSDNNPKQTMKQVVSGTLIEKENFPSKYVAARNVSIWLPEGYSKKKKYSVLYMHDGQMLFDSATTWNKQAWNVDDVLTKLFSNSKIEKCIVVGIWNISTLRHSEYFPQKPFESLDAQFTDSLIQQAKRNEQTPLFSTKVQSDNYLRFIVEELKPYIEKNFSVKKQRENTFIAGSSMGGLISMYALCEYPEIFGGAACLSTHWIGIFNAQNNPIPQAFVDYLTQNLPSPENHKIYFDYGTQTLDALYEDSQLKVDNVMKMKGFTNKNWQTLKFEGHDHSEISWNKRLHLPLTFLLEKK